MSDGWARSIPASDSPGSPALTWQMPRAASLRAQVIKRILDLAVAVPALVMLAPAILVVWVWIKLAHPGPAFYYQPRMGAHGRIIRVWKLRSMYLDAAERLEHLLATNEQARAEWERYFKLTNDPRILPRIGHVIRRTSIDELPQLWCVIRGDMSLIGPRPLPAYHLSRYSPSSQLLRQRVKPGITGLWQVSGRSNADVATQQALDETYIATWSLGLDLAILLRTAVIVLSGHGAR